MNYLAVKDLKKTREMWEMLQRERQLIITRDGKPCAVLVGVSPEMADESVRAIRRALFSLAVQKAREAARAEPISDEELEKEITASRAERGTS